MVGRKPILVAGLVIAVTLQCAQGQIPTSIQFSFDTTTVTGDEAVAAGQAGGQTIFLPVMVNIEPPTALLQGDIIVGVTVTGGTATSGTDFVLVRNQVTFDIGANDDNTISLPVNILDDLLVEGTETFTLTGSVVTTGTIATFVGGPATGNILDNDGVIFQFNPSTYTVAEDVAGGTQAVSLELVSGTLATSIGIQVTVTGGTATAIADFNGPNPIVVTFLAGDGPGTFRSTDFNIVNDNDLEGDETILISGISLSALGQFQAGGDTAVITITDDDAAIFQFIPSTYTVAEDVAGGQQVVSLQLVSGTLTANIGITVTVTGGTATAIADFGGPNPGVVTFLAGDVPGTIRGTVFTIVNDNFLEADETILISGTSQSALGQFQVGGDTAVITIINVSPPVNFQFSASTYNTGEGSSAVAVCVDASALFGRTFQVTVSATPGTATGGGVDYGPITCNPLVFSGTDSQECCNIPITDDFLCEGIETFSVAFTVTGVNANVVPPSTATVFIADNDVKTVGTDQPSYTVTEFEDPQLNFNVLLSGPVTPGPGRSCVVTITAVPGTALNGVDYSANILPSPIVTFTSTSTGPMPRSISILDDLNLEDTESFSLSLSTSSPDCNIPNPLVPVTILDDEDCTGRAGMPCDANAMCEELRGRNNFTCTCIPPFVGDGFMCSRINGMGDDPHFSIVLPSGELLCYTVQGEHGFVFNLITNRKIHMNAMFIPDSRREEVTWLGSMGIIVQNSQYKQSNATYLRFETKGKKIYIGDKVVLEAKNIEKLTFIKGKLTVSEAPPFEGFRYPSVAVDLQDVGLNFTIKFMGEHLDLFWHNTGIHTENSHGLIGQLFQKGVEIDTVRKILILPGKEPVPVMRRPVWSFMEREVADDQLCWTAMNPGYQGEGLIDGTYFDYLVNDILSTDFKFKKRQ